MGRSTLLSFAAAAMIFLLPTGTFAQADGARERALALFSQSRDAYREGRFEEAADLLEEAYALHAEPVLLYNLARALEASGELDDAREAYLSFLAASPDAEQAAASRRRIEVIEELIEEREAAAVPPADPIPTPAPTPAVSAGSGGSDLVGPGLTLGVGLAVSITGSVLLGVAGARYGEAFNAPVHLTAAQLEREAFALRDAGAVVLGIGAAVAVAGTLWLIVAASEGGATSDVALRIGPLHLELEGHF